MWKKFYISFPRDPDKPAEEYSGPEFMDEERAEEEWTQLRHSHIDNRWTELLTDPEFVMFWCPITFMENCGIALIYRRD